MAWCLGGNVFSEFRNLRKRGSHHGARQNHDFAIKVFYGKISVGCFCLRLPYAAEIRFKVRILHILFSNRAICNVLRRQNSAVCVPPYSII